MVDYREQYIASRAPRVKRTHPARSAQALNTSGAGIVHRQMMDLQRQPNLNKADTSRLKDLRRDWNRNRKYTDAGMKISGASSPLDAQKYFADTTRDFRDTNRDAYASMYPLTNLAMEYPQKGGLLGMFLSDIGGKTLDKVKDFGSSLKEGITSALDDTPDEQADYAAKTFGFYPSDVHPGLPGAPEELPPYMREDAGIFGDIPVTEDLPPRGKELNTRIPDWSLDLNKDREMTTTDTDLATDPRPWLQDEIEDPLLDTNEQFFDDKPVVGPDEPLPFDEGKEDFIRRQNEYVSPLPLGSADPQGDFDSFNEYADNESGLEVTVPLQMQEPLPFDDSGREEGIASMMKSGLNLAGRRPYEDVYREFVESSGPSKVMVTYEDFMENYLPRIQESRGVFRAGLNSQGRR